MTAIESRTEGRDPDLGQAVRPYPEVPADAAGCLVNQDMFLGGSIVLMISVLTVNGTLLSDLLLLWVDPRIRVAGRGA